MQKKKKPLSNTQRAVSELRELIFSGKLAAGTEHLEAELADKLKMSRTPVREAVRTLVVQGLIEMRPRKGACITRLSADDMADIYDVLIELEGKAAEQAAQAKHPLDALAPMARSIDTMETALAKEDLQAWAKADDKFHMELVRLGGNRRIISTVEMMRDQVRQTRTMTLSCRPLPTYSNLAHKAVYEAIRDGDPIVARAIHRDHRREAKDLLVGLVSTRCQG